MTPLSYRETCALIQTAFTELIKVGALPEVYQLLRYLRTDPAWLSLQPEGQPVCSPFCELLLRDCSAVATLGVPWIRETFALLERPLT